MYQECVQLTSNTLKLTRWQKRSDPRLGLLPQQTFRLASPFPTHQIYSYICTTTSYTSRCVRRENSVSYSPFPLRGDDEAIQGTQRLAYTTTVKSTGFSFLPIHAERDHIQAATSIHRAAETECLIGCFCRSGASCLSTKRCERSQSRGTTPTQLALSSLKQFLLL